MDIALLHNPRAGEGHSRRTLEKLLRAHGHRCRYTSTQEEGDEEILAEGCDLVLVAGGDGTVAKAVKLLGSKIPYAVLPLGTANNIALSLGIQGTPEEIVASLAQAKPRPFDLAIAEASWCRSRFVESTGVGLFAALLREGRDETGFPRKDDPGLDPNGWGRHRLRGLLERIAPRPCRVEIDGVDRSGAYLMVTAMNIGHIGPRLELAPAADPGDGLLDLLLVREEDRVKFGSWLDEVVRGAPAEFPVPAERGRRIRFEWSDAAGHLDDELWPPPGEIERPVGMVTLEIRERPAQVLVSEARG
jgi:diacylglycerol kinase family enzyme